MNKKVSLILQETLITFEDMASAQQPKHIEICAGKQVQIVARDEYLQKDAS